jgi:hypothetical protein
MNLFIAIMPKALRPRINVGLFKTNINTPGLLGFWTLSIVQYSNKHNVSESGSIAVLRSLPTPHLRMEINPVSEMLCSLEYRTLDRVQKLRNL